MLAKVLSGAVIGLEGVLITVEVDVAGRGFPTFTIVGLANKAIDEAKDRVRTAIVNSGFEMPDSRITVNLAPADIPKSGSAFDLPIAIGILTASGYLESEWLQDALFVGELSLEGEVRGVPGSISLALMAKEREVSRLFMPVRNAHEVAVIDNLEIYPVDNLNNLIAHLRGKREIRSLEPVALDSIRRSGKGAFDFSDIRGQQQAKRALEIAAAGMHNVHLRGVPGAGKTMLSRAFPSILPPMTDTEMLEVSKIYSAVGMTVNGEVVSQRPFRSPHHTTSRNGLIGGGSRPLPGEISLAHRGVLFLDEFPEFPRITLDCLRQPLEDGFVTISRASGSLTFPSRFLLLAASNPCPCGFLGHPSKPCKCSAHAVANYQKRLSGPLLDRIDLHLDIMPVEQDKLIGNEQAETSATVAQRVLQARERQSYRLRDTHLHCNSEMGAGEVRKLCQIAPEAIELLQQAASQLSISARAYYKIIKIAQTIADLANSETVKVEHVAEAMQYRFKD